MFPPRNSQETAIKQIGRYLKATQDQGLILNPNPDIFNLDCYPDADFTGMYGHKLPTD